jgi:uncharacterized membrane protein YfcA
MQALMSAIVVARRGLVVWNVAIPLLLAASVTSFVCAKFAAEHLSKEDQKLCFAAVVSLIGARLLFAKG